MSKEESPARYDAFLSHAHEDAGIVEALASRLSDSGLLVWLDRWELVPGEPWQQAVEFGLGQAQACVVCIGSQAPSGWFRQEIECALNRQVEEPAFRVIPLLLPGTSLERIGGWLKLRWGRSWRDW